MCVIVYEESVSSEISQQRVGERHVPFRIQVVVEDDHLCAVPISDAPPPPNHDTPFESLPHFFDTGIDVRGQLRAGWGRGGGLRCLPRIFSHSPARKSSGFARISLTFCPKIDIWKILRRGGIQPLSPPPRSLMDTSILKFDLLFPLLCGRAFTHQWHYWHIVHFLLQCLLLHLGREKWICSLMRKVYLYVTLTGWKEIKFPLIWYIIYWIVLHSCMKNLNVKSVYFLCFAECTLMWSTQKLFYQNMIYYYMYCMCMIIHTKDDKIKT